MAARRPKKMVRPTGASSSANRLGPGMETVELRFNPFQEGKESVADGAQQGASSTLESTASSPWIITWEVGVGASVDRGLRLARLRRADATKGGGGAGAGAAAAATEQFLVGEDYDSVLLCSCLISDGRGDRYIRTTP